VGIGTKLLIKGKGYVSMIARNQAPPLEGGGGPIGTKKKYMTACLMRSEQGQRDASREQIARAQKGGRSSGDKRREKRCG